MSDSRPVLNRSAAVTRSLLGWGVVAGPFYLVVGIVLGATRPGFDFTHHALSLLTLGHLGWLQRVNFILTGVMVIAAGVGALRAIRSGRGLAIGALIGIAGAALILSAFFLPDPSGATPTGSGVLHMLCGAIQFAAIVAAAVAYALWSRSIGQRGRAQISIALGIGVLIGFLAGAALATQPAGIALLWFAVVCEWIWLAVTSAQIYQWSPHPLSTP